jgi:hypothetical protein
MKGEEKSLWYEMLRKPRLMMGYGLPEQGVIGLVQVGQVQEILER